MWFLFGEVSSSSGCLGWATLFHCGTPWAFHIIIFHFQFVYTKCATATVRVDTMEFGQPNKNHHFNMFAPSVATATVVSTR